MSKNLCESCYNSACPDRCNPSKCEFYLIKPNIQIEKRTQIEFRIYDQELF